MSEQAENGTYRTFKIGSQLIHEDETMQSLSNEEIRDLLKAQYPEVAHATVRENTLEDGTTLISYLPKPGRKG